MTLVGISPPPAQALASSPPERWCTLCTVTGPTVIDSRNHINSVQDRCVYSLIKTPSIPHIQVYPTFQERRRKDVSFLDRVILSLDNPGVNIYLEQGGKVQLDNITMVLNATAQLVHSVELSKDQTGVTAKMSHLNYTMTVFFDGYTAQIYIKGPSGQAPLVEGLCGKVYVKNSQAFCQARFCSTHEFCGENSNGDGTRCFCRALFASAYTSQNSLGGVVNCGNNARTVTLVGCLLEDQGISYTDLHLYDKACLAQMDPVTHMVTITFDIKTNPCGTIIKVGVSPLLNNSQQVTRYERQPSYQPQCLETTSEELIGVTCPFVIPDITIDFSVTFKVKSGSSSSSVAYVTSRVWNYTVTMMAYTDPGRTQAVGKDTELHLNQRVWFELKADGLDDKNVALVTDSCFATNTPSPNSSLSYDLIMNG
ncbi:uncharacterized protein LOC144516114 [Sander vitreus]